MNKQRFLRALLLIALFSISGLTQESKRPSGQAQETVLDRELSRRINPSSTRLRDLLSEIFNSAGVPGGIVLASNDGEGLEKIEPVSFSLRDVLDSIVMAKPGYRWSLEDRVVNVVPTINLPELLDVRVSKFTVKNVTKGEALNALKEIREVKDSIKSLRLNEFSLFLCCGLSNPPPPPPPKRFSIDYKNATVREILNAIAREHGRSVWVYSEWQDWPESSERYFQLYLD